MSEGSRLFLSLQERVSKLNECFLRFTADPLENIRSLTSLCGELMGAACALYNRLDSGFLHTMAHWNAPPDLKLVDSAEGHLCHDVIRQGGSGLFSVRNLTETPYAESDPNVMRYGLHTYVGMPVRCGEKWTGSLCVVFQEDYAPDEEDRKFMEILAIAVGVEEERRIAAEELRRTHIELERRVKERTAELARANDQLRIDIAERKKAEEALWKSEKILRNIFEAIPDMVSVIDRELRVVQSNWQGGYEYVPESVREGSPICHEAFYPEQGRPCEDCHALKVFQTGKAVSSEKYNPRIGLLEVRAFPIFDDSGEVVMVAEYVRDITEHRRLEEELRRAHKLESLGVLAGGIAHDFNNLLTGILGNISMVKIRMHPGDKGYSGLENAEKAAGRARDLTQQLLTFSKGGAPIKKIASIEQIVRDSASFVLRGSNVRCDFTIGDNVWPVEVDEGQMNQVINNLIINADQAMPEGGTIEVGIDNLSVGINEIPTIASGRYVKISIRDHGTGIPAEHLHKIFDPYFTTKLKGSGLGLATVYSIMKSHGGYIWVESDVGAGTEFHLYLPASDKELPAAGLMKEKMLAGSGKILIMDDEEIIREVASGMLTHFGFEVVACNEGKEAVELYSTALHSARPFSAVIMDLTIPGGMGGRETMKKLLEIDDKAVGIVSSGYCNDPILSQYSDYGFRGVVAKPYNLEELGKVVQDLLSAT